MKTIPVMLACIVFAGASVATAGVARAADPVPERMQIQTRTKSGTGSGDMLQTRQRLRVHQADAKHAQKGSQRQLREAARQNGKGAGVGKGVMRRDGSCQQQGDMKERRAQHRGAKADRQQGAKKQCKGGC